MPNEKRAIRVLFAKENQAINVLNQLDGEIQTNEGFFRDAIQLRNQPRISELAKKLKALRAERQVGQMEFVGIRLAIGRYQRSTPSWFHLLTIKKWFRRGERDENEQGEG